MSLILLVRYQGHCFVYSSNTKTRKKYVLPKGTASLVAFMHRFVPCYSKIYQLAMQMLLITDISYVSFHFVGKTVCFNVAKSRD